MSETETSGAPMGSAETTNPPAAFGASRGSGLARGKRPAAPAAITNAPASTGEYQPTAIEVLTPKSDYHNPFAEPAPAAPANESKPTIAPAPAASVVHHEAPAAKPAEAYVKPHLNILPPEQTKHVPLSWENGSSPSAAAESHDGPARSESRPRHDERPVFRTERQDRQKFEPRDSSREQKPFESREPRHEQKSFDPREPRGNSRRESRPFESREPLPKPVVESAPKKSGGFFSWLKNLFGSPQPAETNGRSAPDGEHGRDDHRQHRRRHRGGRGRGGFRDGQQSNGGHQDQRGGRGFRDGAPRDGQSQSEGPRHDGHGQHGDQRFDGGQRRRSRGGRGRNRNFRPGDQPRGGPPAS